MGRVGLLPRQNRKAPARGIARDTAGEGEETDVRRDKKRGRRRASAASQPQTHFYVVRGGRGNGGRERSKAWAMRRRRASSVTAPMSWRPTGRPSGVRPQGR